MYYGFILTHSMYPIDKKLELKDCCFDNPRTSQEIKAVAQILKKRILLEMQLFQKHMNNLVKKL